MAQAVATVVVATCEAVSEARRALADQSRSTNVNGPFFCNPAWVEGEATAGPVPEGLVGYQPTWVDLGGNPLTPRLRPTGSC